MGIKSNDVGVYNLTSKSIPADYKSLCSIKKKNSFENKTLVWYFPPPPPPSKKKNSQPFWLASFPLGFHFEIISRNKRKKKSYLWWRIGNRELLVNDFFWR